MTFFQYFSSSALSFLLFSSACTQSAKIDRECYIEKDRKLLFLGVEQCFDKVPVSELEGLWISEFENSIFLPKNTKFREYTNIRDHDAIWLEIRPDLAKQNGIRYDKDRYYIIKFEGFYPKERGIFGHMGMFSRGIMVKRIISINEISKPREL